ncbi:uncharacterized protein LOC116215663 [Punica granatum]|uniref:Uncharacterized protein LOC116215663 n=1 Tax=Punica granatum TaxID=22663 RepID=A0A6P8EQG6_PUNGR|nr:uncharacterized protein LOC116215663 [Punica granatum]XP_031407326.1 uncharacterized protein LOC116215663 [Punica granatum]
MPCTLSRTQSDISGISERGKASLPLKSLEQQNTATSEVCSGSPVIWHNRCALLTFLTLESDGNWKILAVPVQCPDNTNPLTRHSRYTGRSSSGSRVRIQPRNGAIPDSSVLPDSKADGTIRTCTSKKARKKGKQGKKLPLNCGSAEISPLSSQQGDLQGNLNSGRDTSVAIIACSDQIVPEKFPVSDPENQLKTKESRRPGSPSSNGSSELDIALVSSDGNESLKIDSSASDEESGHIQKEPVNSNPCQKVLNDAIDLADQREETGRSNNKNVAKKNNRVRTVVNIPSASRSGSFGNSHFHNTGKENSHPVWQKVQRKVGNKHDSSKVNHIHVETNEAPRDEDKKHRPAKDSGKVKRKHCPNSKQESNRYLRKGSSINKSELRSSNKSAHSTIPSVSEVASPSGSPRDQLRTGEAECLNPEAVEDSRVCHDGLQLNGDKSSSTANSDLERMEDLDRSLEESRVDQNIMISPVCTPHLLANGVNQSGKEDVLSESCGQKSTAGSVTQKWVPVGTKALAATGLTGKSCISVENGQAEACQEQTPGVDSESTITLSISEVENNCSPSEEEGQTESTENSNSGVPEEQNHRVASDSSVISEFKSQFETDLDRLARAIGNAHRAQLASEAVHMATGGPIAEFERLLHSSSPVVSPSHSIATKTCSRNHLTSTMGIHETPDIPLGCLWQWYQKHGSFGLEVRGKDYNNSKRLGIDRFSFRAYFVPYLSAVQLFRGGKGQMRKSSIGDPDNFETYENSTVGNLPIFPLLVPRASKADIASQTVKSAESHESELIFEYFELEPPQQRRPLYEKIQELVRGDGPSRDKAYGDPSELNSINLQDLDPRSWYSVAWYPIYRIPDGDFRAAFLTYHSLGHFVRRDGLDNCVASPVVGLQSYNAQNECWFQLRPPLTSQKSQIPSLDPSKILTERLRTLEDAASLMSRTAVSKGNGLTSVNNHPDFEFFLSRRRYY